jgi:hypothetical protein
MPVLLHNSLRWKAPTPKNRDWMFWRLCWPGTSNTTCWFHAKKWDFLPCRVQKAGANDKSERIHHHCQDPISRSADGDGKDDINNDELDIDDTQLLPGDRAVLDNHIMHVLQTTIAAASSNFMTNVLSNIIFAVGTTKRGILTDMTLHPNEQQCQCIFTINVFSTDVSFQRSLSSC